MMKRLFYILVSLVLFCAACRAPIAAPEVTVLSPMDTATPQATITPEATADTTPISQADAEALLVKTFGTVDADTGNPFSFVFEDTVTIDDVEYYNFRISWLVDNDHLSYVTNFLVSFDGTVQKEYTPVPTGDDSLLATASAVLCCMRDEDAAAMAPYIHEDKGVRFTPYSTVDPATDRTIAASSFASFFTDPTEYVWGTYDGSGEPIELTNAAYWERFVWNTDYTTASDVSVNEIVQSGISIENLNEQYPDASFVDYHFSGFDPEYGGIDWSSLKLVFEPVGGQWMLVAIIHGEWTI